MKTIAQKLIKESLTVARVIAKCLCRFLLIVVGILLMVVNFLLGFMFDLFVDILNRLNGENRR